MKKIVKSSQAIESKDIKPIQGIFYDGQITQGFRI